jgi:uncharacterized alkaline shock family protein YloU
MEVNVNRVNRAIVIVGLVLAIALMPILVVMLLSLSPALVETWAGLARGLLVGPTASYTQAIGIAVAVLIFVVAVVLFVLEIQRPALSGLRVQQVSDGEVQVTAEAITQRLQNEILRIPEVTKVKSHVTAAKKGLVDLFLQIETTPEVNIPEKTQEIIQAARHLTEEKIGLKLGKVQVQVDHSRPPKGETHPTKTIPPTTPGSSEAMMVDR